MERSHLKVLAQRMLEPRRHIQVVFGPRQTGKTTLVRQYLGQSPIPGMYESADAIPAGNSVWLEQIWTVARMRMRANNLKDYMLVIDEVQKIPQWSSIVKKCWDTDTMEHINLKVILTGSSRLLIQSGLTESLAGRFETLYLGHWTFPEMQSAFGWSAETWSWFGGYPGSASPLSEVSDFASH